MDTPQAAAAVAAIATTIKAEMAEKGLTEKGASLATGIPLTTLNRHLTGVPPGFPTMQLFLLASLLGKDASELVRQSEQAADAA